jgi:hypothetical protein
MILELEQPCMEPFDPANDLRVLIACEDATAGRQACAMLERIGRGCGRDGRLIYQWWNFELLSITSLQELAGRQVAVADVIIVAARIRDDLPRQIANWFARWMTNRQGRHGAMVALLDSNLLDSNLVDSDASPGVQGFFSRLRELAALGSMDFFAETVGNAGTTGSGSKTMVNMGNGLNSDGLPEGEPGWCPALPYGQRTAC